MSSGPQVHQRLGDILKEIQLTTFSLDYENNSVLAVGLLQRVRLLY